METIRRLLRKYKEPILYVFFGGLTTLLNMTVYFVCTKALKMGLEISDILAWIAGVLFAYVTNKLFVFESRNRRGRQLWLEFGEFVGARVLSLVVDVLFLEITVKGLGWWDVPMKILANIIVIIMNYVFSKLFIFKKKEETKDEPI